MQICGLDPTWHARIGSASGSRPCNARRWLRTSQTAKGLPIVIHEERCVRIWAVPHSERPISSSQFRSPLAGGDGYGTPMRPRPPSLQFLLDANSRAMKDSDQQACRITSLFLWASANIVPAPQCTACFLAGESLTKRTLAVTRPRDSRFTCITRLWKNSIVDWARWRRPRRSA
jgi:hypothetical protein